MNISFCAIAAAMLLGNIPSGVVSSVSSKKVLNESTTSVGDADIDAIRAEYKRINGLKLKADKFTFEDIGCVAEGEVTYYSQGKSILKIIEKGTAGDGSWTIEYYYKDGKLIFALEVITGGPAAGPDVTTEYRYYAKNDKPLRQMENDKIIKADSKFTEVLTASKKLPKAKESKNFAEALCE